ncbi:unnamed protein product [Amaranthus hypochondriacus]
MKGPANFGMVMVLVVGIMMASSTAVQCAVVFGININFKKMMGGGDNVPMSSSLGPVSAPAPAPAPGPLGSRRSGSGLVIGFYNDKCNSDIEEIIETLTLEEFDNDPTILPALLRLQFHDCFVHGCDASILINGTSTEKTAGSNLSVRGYEFIERLKTAVEAECPGIVSCADIIVIATKVVIKLGGGLDFPVETGRRDGLVSNALDVDLPSPSMTIDQAFEMFARRNFTLEEMVVLLGYHAVGITHCNFFQPRLFEGSSLFDPLMDKSLAGILRQLCPQGAPTNNETPLNQDLTNNNTLNNGFYNQLIANRGILALDQLLSRDTRTSPIVAALAQNITLFQIRTAQVMIKLQAVEVLTGNEGEIRKVCSKFNN